MYSRAATLLRPDRTVGFTLNSLKQAVYGADADLILLVNYDDLCKTPAAVMQDIYKFIGEKYFDHDFNNLEASYDEFDQDVNLKGMHSVRKTLSHLVREPILPPDLWHQTMPLSFWKSS